MGDLISRQTAIDVLAAMQGQCTSKAALVQNSKIWQQIKDLPSAQPQQWIPCSERFPEMDTDVLVTDDNGDVFICRRISWFDGEKGVPAWETDDWTIIDAEIEMLAWMPLPEPWKGEEG